MFSMEDGYRRECLGVRLIMVWVHRQEPLEMRIFVCFGHPVACRILVPQPGSELMPLTVEALGLNHWIQGVFKLDC